MPWRVVIAFLIGCIFGAVALYLYLQSSDRLTSVQPPSKVAVPAQSAPKPIAVPAVPRGSVVNNESLAIPVAGISKSELRDQFTAKRGSREHGAIDIMAPRGTPVLAAVDGKIRRLFVSKPGGITLYLTDPAEKLVYYYAHLDGYAPDIREGKPVLRGEIIGYVGSTGNAPKDAPHLHFQIMILPPTKEWWKGEPVNPFPLLSQNGITYEVPATAR